MMSQLKRFAWMLMALLAVLPTAVTAQDIPLSPTVTRLLDDPLTTEPQRRALALFHGQWQRITEPTLAEQAHIALARFELDHPSLQSDAAPPRLRAEAALWRGEAQATLDLLVEADNPASLLLRATAHQHLGQLPQAVTLLAPLREALQRETFDDAADLTAAAEALLMLARLEGRPAQDYHLAVRLFAKVRDELDRLYWPAHLAEARLLLARDNAHEGQEAAVDALRLNPRAGEAFYLLGDLAAHNYDFEKADAALAQLRRIHKDHLLAAILEARMRLVQKDPHGALPIIENVLARYPQQRDMLALLAAAHALAWDEQGMNEALEHFEVLFADSAEAWYTVGRYLSLARQYGDAETMLRQAVEREPNWPEPRIELGLLLMQWGDEVGALEELRHAARLDPFHRRASNQLTLVEELLGYERIETDNFIIKYREGIDAVLARDMAEYVEQMYREVTAVFEHRPANRTLIDLMPDEQWFGVRITGIPEIWTIAACTGDVIAMTPPRSGPNQRGSYNWPNVLRHEFGHTVTLDKTHNRIPHWFTEACSVSIETVGRSYQTCRLLATALHEDRLFKLDDINWGFIRPRTPLDRPLAYAQADWMLEYLAVAHGHDALVTMLRMFREGATDLETLRIVTGQNADEFFQNFQHWAHQQVNRWGLGAQMEIPDLAGGSAANISDARLAKLLDDYPEHPEVLRVMAGRAVERADAETARQAVLRYAATRPIDPWSYRQMVRLSQKTGRTDELIGSLQQLDRQEDEHGQWAFQLAQLHRAADRLDDAAAAAERALHREPYSAEYRELAAALALQRGRIDRALHHMEALPLLEPDRALHAVRLAALYTRLNEPDKAHAYAQRALEIDPDAPVLDYLQKVEE